MDPLYLASLLKFHRKKAKLSQAELAALAGIGKTAVFDLEKGKLSIQFTTLLKVLHTLNITITFNGPLIDLFEEGYEKS